MLVARRMNHVNFPSRRYAKVGINLFEYHWYLAKKFVASERTY